MSHDEALTREQADAVLAAVEALAEELAASAGPEVALAVAQLGQPTLRWLAAQVLGTTQRRDSSPAQRPRRTLPVPLRRLRDTGAMVLAGLRRVPTGEVWVVSLQANATRASVPVVEALEARGVSVRFVLLATDPASRRAIQGRAFTTLEPRVRPHDLAVAVRGVSGVLGTRAVTRLLPLVTPLALDGGRMNKLAATLLRRLDREYWIRYLEACALRRLLAEGRPVAMMAMSDHVLVAGAATGRFGASRPEIPCAVLLQGVIPDYPAYAPALNAELAIVGSSLDLAYTRRMTLRRGVVTPGYFEYDRFSSLDRSAAREALRRHVGVGDGTTPIVLFTSQYPTDAFPNHARRANLDAFVETARQRPDMHFLIKAHPRREDLGDAWVRAFPTNAAVLEDFDTATAIAGADVSVTYWSTTALEAVLLGTPLVQLNATGLPDFYDLCQRWGATPARTAEELGRGIDAVLSGSAARAQRDSLGDVRLDGQGATRAAEAVSELFVARRARWS